MSASDARGVSMAKALDVFRMLPAPAQVAALGCGSVYLVHTIYRALTRSFPKPVYTLSLRRLRSSGADMLEGSLTGNAFLDEYNLLTDLLFPKLDLCVMKALGKDIPLLSKQEQLHAKMHNEAQAERKRRDEGFERWGWYIYLADLFLLRLGKEVGCACAGHAEATSGVWFYLPMVSPFTKGFMSNEYAYHAMEELEHGPLTTQYLRTQVSTLSPLLTLPVMTITCFVYFMTPPVMAVAVNPLLLVRSKTYSDLVKYYAAFFPTFLATIYACVAYWALPFRENDDTHEQRYSFFCGVVRERGVEFDVVGQAAYRVEGNLVQQVVVEQVNSQ